MLVFCVLPLLLAAATAEKCYEQMLDYCGTKGVEDATKVCTAEYGEMLNNKNTLLSDLQGFANLNMKESFDLLRISSYFGNYNVNREGFKKLYRKYSDKLWEDSINVMKYIAKRGGVMNFEQPLHPESDRSKSNTTVALPEIKSLALVLDKQKDLAKKAFEIYQSANAHVHNDPAIAHFIEEKFLEAHTERIRDLSGYITELKGLLKSSNPVSVALFVFDEFLQKSL